MTFFASFILNIHKYIIIIAKRPTKIKDIMLVSLFLKPFLLPSTISAGVRLFLLFFGFVFNIFCFSVIILTSILAFVKGKR